jgi:Uma2 family endonuclease
MITYAERMTIEQFEELLDSGRYEKSRERVELIRGELRIMSPAGPDHDEVLTYLEDWSTAWAGKYGYRKRSEKGVTFPSLASVPEPDIVWVKKRRYRKARPTVDDVVFAIEVSFSSLTEDRSEMMDLYAEAGIAEYWIANCIDNVIEIHRRPVAGVYQDRFVVKPGETVSPLVAPDAVLDVGELFSEEDDIE